MLSDQKNLRFDMVERQLVRPLSKIVGWQERVTLPNFGRESIVAKIDSGALSSCLHGYDLRTRWMDGAFRVSFRAAHPGGWSDARRRYSARVVDEITVRSSNGKLDRRFVIETPLQIGDDIFEVRLSLTDRSSMQYALLVGRDAIQARFLIDCNKSFVTSER